MSFTALAYPYPGANGFFWQKRNDPNWTPVLANRDLLILSTAQQSFLTILNITNTNYGQYKLTVNNSLGTYIQHYNLKEKISDKGIVFFLFYREDVYLYRLSFVCLGAAENVFV
jgi:hypothetical protein